MLFMCGRQLSSNPRSSESGYIPQVERTEIGYDIITIRYIIMTMIMVTIAAACVVHKNGAVDRQTKL